MSEETLWEGRSSQLVNAIYIVFCCFTFWLIIPLIATIYALLRVACRRYTVTSERIRIREGILTKYQHEMELYRIKDTTLIEPFILRLFGLGTIVIHSSDRSTPTIKIEGIPIAEKLREALRQHVEKARTEKRVREVDFN